MAPMFTDSASHSTKAPPQKPAFSFNTRDSRVSNFFAAGPVAPSMQQQEQQMDGSWDMGDDVSDETHNDNSDPRALVHHTGEQDDSTHLDQLDTYPEIDEFAVRLDSSRILQSDPNSPRTAVTGFDLIEHFKEFSAARLEVLRGHISEDSAVEERAELEYWKLEHQTWDLFGTLSSHRLNSDMQPRVTPDDLVKNKYTSNQRLKEHLMDMDTKFKEWNLILQWLWTYATDPEEGFDEGLVRYGSGWVYTKEALKAQKRLGGKKMRSLATRSNIFFGEKTERKGIITELDPDAPSRQQKQLEPEDEEAESNFMKFIWGFIRKGDLPNAIQLCSEFGEWWRGASLSGGDEAWDPTIDGVRRDAEDNDMNNDAVTGNRRRELWRRMCFAIARKPGGDDWEKAVYGVLCGDVESVQAVCGSWEDNLFAHINSLVEEYYSTYLSSFSRIPTSATIFPIFNSTGFHSKAANLSDDETILPRIIDSLAAAEVLKDESRQPLRIIQGALISLRFPELVEELERQLRLIWKDSRAEINGSSYGLNVSDPHTLRVVVHIILILQSLNAGFTEQTPHLESAEALIAGYIDVLSNTGKTELIPLYAGRLSPNKAVEVMGNILVNVKDETRLELLKLMKMHQIDVEGCLKKTMDICLELTEERHKRDGRRIIRLAGLKGDIGLNEDLREEDEMLIRGLEWLVLGGDGLKSEVIKKVIVVYKRFLLAGRLSAAMAVYERINSESIINPPDHTGHQADLGDEARKLFKDYEVQWALSVYVEFEILIRALSSIEAWNETLKKRPERSDRLWKNSLISSYENVQTKLSELVKTWLDNVLEEAPYTIDTAFLKGIRNIYTPELTFALHDVYVEAGKWINKQLLANCLELATVVADPTRSVLACFVETGRVEEYVYAVAGASRSVLGAKADKGPLTIWNVR